MRIAYSPLLALCLTLSLPSQTPAPPQYGSLELTIVDSRSDGPVAGAIAVLEGKLQVPQPVSTFVASSDAQGRTLFANLPPGTYSLQRVEKRGYQTRISNAAPSTRDIIISPLAKIRGPKVSLDRLGSIQGRVFDSSGDPISGVSIRLYTDHAAAGRRGATAVQASETKEQGEYHFDGLYPGRYYVRVEPALLNAKVARASSKGQASNRPEGFADTFYPNASELTQAQVMMVDPASTLVDVDIRLQKTPLSRVEGQVVGVPDSASSPEVSIQSCGPDGYLLYPPSSSVAVNGSTFSFLGLAPGTYCVSYQDLDPKNSGRPKFLARELATVTPSQDIANLKLTTAPTATISGTIRVDGKPSARPVLANLITTDVSGSSHQNSDASGHFTFQNVLPDRYWLVIPSDRYRSDTPPDSDVYLRSITYNDRDVSDGILETRGEEGALVLDYATGAGGVSGHVEGSQLAGMKVTILPEGALRTRFDLQVDATLESDGQFRAPGLAPGSYRVYVWSEYPGVELIRMPEFQDRLAAESTRFMVSAGQTSSVTAKPIPALLIKTVVRAF